MQSVHQQSCTGFTIKLELEEATKKTKVTAVNTPEPTQEPVRGVCVRGVCLAGLMSPMLAPVFAAQREPIKPNLCPLIGLTPASTHKGLSRQRGRKHRK